MREEILDCVVVGAGISGLGVACAIAQKTSSLAVLERKTVGQETSANSLRIMHGGIRYLQQLDLLRAVRSFRDQRRLLERYPELVKPLSCLMPLNRSGMKSRIPVSLGAGVYRALTALVGGEVALAKVIDTKSAQAALPEASELFSCGALYWQDACLINHHQLCARLLVGLREMGCTIEEHCEVKTISQESECAAITTSKGVLRARAVVLTTGPWVSQSLAENLPFSGVGLAKAFNLIFDRKQSWDSALGLTSHRGRLLFFTPREDEFAVGTWYTAWNSPLSQPTVSPEEVSAAVEECSRLMPRALFSADSVRRVEVGLLPMRAVEQGGEPVLYGRDLIQTTGRIISVLSTKYTTFLSLGEQVSRTIQKSGFAGR